MVGIMERVAKINGVIPDRSLITVDQRAMKFDQPVTFNIEASTDRLGIDELAKVIQETTGTLLMQALRAGSEDAIKAVAR